MGYVKKTLAPGEDYRFRAHFNWTYDFQSWFWLLLGAIPLLIWAVALFSAGPAPSMGAGFYSFADAAFLIGLVILTTRYVHRWTTVIAITSLRLILKTGLIARQSHEVPLDKIEEVFVNQSFLGRIFGYGVLTVHGTGVTAIEFPVLDKPVDLRRRLETAVSDARRKPAAENQAKAAES